MLRETHESYAATLRESSWIVRLQILYLGALPLLVTGALIYLIAR